MKEPRKTSQKKLYEHYCGYFDKLSDFSTVLSKLTENYCCMVVDNKSLSSNITDCVYWYKATPRKNFKINSASMWAYHDAYYNLDYKRQESEQNLQNLGKLIK